MLINHRRPSIVWPLVAGVLLAGGCDGDSGATTPGVETGTESVEVPALVELLPADTQTAVSVDLAALGAQTATLWQLLGQDDADPALSEPFKLIESLAAGVDLVGQAQRLVLIQGAARDGFALAIQTEATALDALLDSSALEALDDYQGRPTFRAASGQQVVWLGDGVAVAGNDAAVAKVVDVAVDAASTAGSPVAPYVSALDATGAITFVHAMPGEGGGVSMPGPGDVTLRAAEMVTGSVSVSAEAVSGQVDFYTPNAESFVTRFNELRPDRADEVSAAPALVEGGPAAVRVSFEDSPVVKPGAALSASRATLKALFYGMDSVDYTDAVGQGSNDPWMNFDVGGDPNSIFVNFEFTDEAQVAAFEANELPAGFKLAPIRVLEGDEPAYFLVLNIYNSSGGLVEGARAEWSVFVQDPEVDRPRFLVIQAAAAAVSADSVNLVTQPEPVTHELQGNQIVSYVGLEGDGGEANYWTSSITWPPQTEVLVKTAREFVAANDYIYWGNAVADRTLYNASIYNRDAVLIDNDNIVIQDDSRWAQYVKPEPRHSYVYLNPLEIVISPWWNLDADYLDVTDDYRQELVDFKDTFYPMTVSGIAADAMNGEGDALSSFVVPNDVPTAYYHFPITDVAGLENALGLEAGQLLPISLLPGAEAQPVLTLRVYQVEGSLEGMRAEWLAYVDRGQGRAQFLALEVLSERAAVDPLTLLSLPDSVVHAVEGDSLNTRLAAPGLRFEAAFAAAAGDAQLPAMDWLEAGDYLCRVDGTCSKLFYDGNTLDEPVTVVDGADVELSGMTTPWDAFIASQPVSVFVRSNAQQYAWNPWRNLPL